VSRTIVVGDIHGCYSELQDLLGQIKVEPEDKLVSVGDLVAKGPQNRRVLEFFQSRANTHVVLGNHERVLLKYYRGEAAALEPDHFSAIADLGDDFERHMEWISCLPHYIDLSSHVVVHAGIRAGRKLEEQTVEDLTELRALDGPTPGSRAGTPWFERYQDDKGMIFGHWVFAAPFVRGNVIGIDTGCVYGGRLTAVVLPELRIVSVPAHRAYAVRKE
jgi:hypothetical protein